MSRFVFLSLLVPFVLVDVADRASPGTEVAGGVPAWPARPSRGGEFVEAVGGLVADGSLPVRVDVDGTLRFRSRAATMGLRLASIAGRERPARGTRIEAGEAVVDRGLAREWLVRTAVGLEHGVDLLRRPGDPGEVRVRLEVEGGRAIQDGADALLVDASGRSRFAYRELRVHDARGALLRASMIAHGDGIDLVFDDRGARYPVRVDPFLVTTFDTLSDATADRDVDAQCGFSVATHGGIAVVGCPADDAPGAIGSAGSVLVFGRTASTAPWMPITRLTMAVPLANARFGHSVDFDGTTIVVGAPGATEPAVSSGGLAFTFRNTAGWAPHAALRPLRTTASGAFGWSVAVEGDRVLVGAPEAALATDAGNTASGVAVGYSIATATATLLGEVNGPSPAAGDRFGESLALRGGTAVVGAPRKDEENLALTDAGAAYVYTLQNNALYVAELDDPTPTGSARFGADVALSTAGFAVGKPLVATTAGGSAGQVVVFRPSNRAFLQTIEATNPLSADFFGYSVAMDGDALLVGAATTDNANSSVRAGSAWLYVRDGERFLDVARLLPSDTATGDATGYDVAVDWAARTAVLGVPRDTVDGSTRAGSAKVFGVPDYHFLRVMVIGQGQVDSTPNGISCGARCVAVYATGEVVTLDAIPFAGSYLASVDGDCDEDGCDVTMDRGRSATFVFAAQHPNGEECEDDDECLDGACIDGVCCDQRCGEGVDDCEACSVADGATTDGVCGPLRGERAGEVVCRVSAGGCDPEETCVGSSRSCPADLHSPSGEVCRPAVHPLCDTEESCDGVSLECPTDVVVAAATSCDDGRGCNGADVCDGLGGCASTQPVVCPDDGNPCTSDACLDDVGCVSVHQPGCIVVDGGAYFPEADGGIGAAPDLRGAGGCTCSVGGGIRGVGPGVTLLSIVLAGWLVGRRIGRKNRPLR